MSKINYFLVSRKAIEPRKPREFRLSPLKTRSARLGITRSQDYVNTTFEEPISAEIPASRVLNISK